VAVIKDAAGGPGGNVLIPSLCPEVGVLLCLAGYALSLCVGPNELGFNVAF
jgi:hypothetical protein